MPLDDLEYIRKQAMTLFESTNAEVSKLARLIYALSVSLDRDEHPLATAPEPTE